jgi:pimeloyl-ACP methyl ester carboxylesterase
MDVESDELTLQLRHLRLSAVGWGENDRPPVLALHGWLDNAASFERLAPLIGDARIVALDLPAHGRSDHWPVGHVHHFVDWVPVVIEAADALGWQSFSLLGHSMGAGIASLLPAVIPDRIDRLAMLEGVGPAVTPPEKTPEQLASAIASESELSAAGNRWFPDLSTAVRARCRDSDLDSASAELLVRRGTETTDRGVRFTHDPRMKSRSRLRLTEEQVRAFLIAIGCPTLVVGASSGWPLPPDFIKRRVAMIPDVTVVQVEGGHHVHLTHPERVAGTVREFLFG